MNRRWAILAIWLGYCSAWAGGEESVPPTNASQVVDRFVEALGGKAAIQGISAYHARGAFELAQPRSIGGFEIFQRSPDNQFLRIDLGDSGIYDRGFDGTVRWSFNPRPGYRRGRTSSFHVSQGFQRESTNSALICEALDLYATLHTGPHFENMTFLGKTNYDGKEMFQLRIERTNGVLREYFDAQTGLREAMEFGRTNAAEIIRFHEYKQFGSCKFPSKISRSEQGILRDGFIIQQVDYEDVLRSQFAIPMHVADWPVDWHCIQAAYPPDFAINRPWPWHGEHYRWANEGFAKAEDEFFWSHAVLNSLQGEVLEKPAEIRSALWSYDASLYGDTFPQEKIEVLIHDTQSTRKSGHATTVCSVQINGFAPEPTQNELTTHLRVYRWFCPKAERTAFLVLRSPQPFQEEKPVWRTLLTFYERMVCHLPE